MATKSARCKHSELVITETGDWITEHSRSEGKWEHCNEPGGYGRRLDVRCCDCGYSATHWRGEKNMPKWLRDALDELGINYWQFGTRHAATIQQQEKS